MNTVKKTKNSVFSISKAEIIVATSRKMLDTPAQSPGPGASSAPADASVSEGSPERDDAVQTLFTALFSLLFL